jgi:dimethylhistidine N-methyltransferase
MLAMLRSKPRSIAPKYFYDAAGSQLFDRICALPEYYPTRVETAMLRAHAAEFAALMGPAAELVEFGAGSLTKVRILIDATQAAGLPLARYVPIDISGEHLDAAAAELRTAYPGLQVQPLVADYGQPFELPVLRSLDSESPKTFSENAPDSEAARGRLLGFFPGSTIGNYTPSEAVDFFRMAAGVLRGGALLIGADLIKDPAILHAAYSDAKGVTGAFNLNLLARANRELGANFDLDQWAHSAFYNAPQQRIEMHLMSRSAQTVDLQGAQFAFAEGETIHTENSYKFTIAGLQALAAQAGFVARQAWTDPERRFSLHWLEAPR